MKHSVSTKKSNILLFYRICYIMYKQRVTLFFNYEALLLKKNSLLIFKAIL